MIRSRLPHLVAALAVALPAAPARAGAVSGTLLLDGRPVAGAAVAAYPHEEPHEKARREARGEPEAKPLATAASGPDGAFSLSVPAVPGKEVLFRLRVAAKGAVPAELVGPFDAAETEELDELALRKAEALAGRVTGPGGKPVAGARVTLRAPASADRLAAAAVVPQEARTGADGTFRFDSAAGEGNALLVEAAGLAPARLDGARAGALPRPVAVTAGAALSGSVKGRDGKPAPGVLVRFEAGALSTRWTETGADGGFRLPDLPSRRGKVVADAGEAGFAEASVAGPGPGRAPLALVLAPPSVLEGRTLDVSSLKPVARVRVVVGTDDGLRAARSGADGRYRVRGLRPGSVGVRADEPRHVLWTRSSVTIERGATTTLDVPLTRGAALSGRVVDEDGRAVSDARLVLSGPDEGPFALAMRARAGDPGARIRSRADGAFSAARLAPGGNQRLTARHPEYEKATIGGIALAPGGARTGVVVALRRGLVVTGVVKDPEGNPVAGAELALGPSLAIRSSRGGMRIQRVFGGPGEIPSARSGPDGRFEIRGVPAGDFSLTAKAPGRATEFVDPLKLVRDVPPEPVEVVLHPGAAIAGAVLRKTGGGAEGYFVVARPAGKMPTPNLVEPGARPTGPDGAFLVDGLRAGETYDLQLLGGVGAIRPGPAKKGIVAPAADVAWVVEGTGAIEGTALDAKTGRPLGAFEVSFVPDAPGFGGMAFRRIGRGSRGAPGTAEPLLVEAPDGRFALEEVPAGKWQVVVEAKGYQAGRASGVVVEEGTITDGVEVRVAPASVLRGRVTDGRSGRGVPEANVTVRATAGPGGGGPGAAGSVVTDVEGRFEVDGMGPGRLTVVADHPDYTPRTESVELKEGGSSVEVALSKGSALGGVVLSESRQPVPGADVTLEGGAGRGGGFGGGETTVADPAGRFRFEHLAPGRYKLRASVPGQATEPVETVLVEGEPAGDVTLVLAGGATVRGVVTGLPDSLRGSVFVNASGAGDYWAAARTGPDGRFELTGAPAGMLSLRATAGDFLSGATRSASEVVEIAEGQKEIEAEIRFEGAGALSGRVTRGGQPVADARVVLGGGRSAGPASGRTDESGAYRIEGIPDGDYPVTVQGAPGAGGRGVTREVRVEGEAHLDVELPVSRLYGLVVDGATKEPLADVRVTAALDAGDGGRGGGMATTDTGGRFFVDDVEEGAYTLTFRRTGYQEAKASASATVAGGDAGTVEMTRGEGLELRVRDGLYQIPLRSVSVRVKDGTGATVVSTWVTLDGDGKGEVSSLRPGRYALVVSAFGYAARLHEGVSVPGAPLPVALTPGGSVEIRPGEAARARGFATLLDAFGRPYPHQSYGVEGRVVLLPAPGSEVLENVAPGSYTLAVEGLAPKAFTVAEGSRTVVELP